MKIFLWLLFVAQAQASNLGLQISAFMHLNSSLKTTMQGPGTTGCQKENQAEDNTEESTSPTCSIRPYAFNTFNKITGIKLGSQLAILDSGSSVTQNDSELTQITQEMDSDAVMTCIVAAQVAATEATDENETRERQIENIHIARQNLEAAEGMNPSAEMRAKINDDKRKLDLLLEDLNSNSNPRVAREDFTNLSEEDLYEQLDFHLARAREQNPGFELNIVEVSTNSATGEVKSDVVDEYQATKSETKNFDRESRTVQEVEEEVIAAAQARGVDTTKSKAQDELKRVAARYHQAGMMPDYSQNESLDFKADYLRIRQKMVSDQIAKRELNREEVTDLKQKLSKINSELKVVDDQIRSVSSNNNQNTHRQFGRVGTGSTGNNPTVRPSQRSASSGLSPSISAPSAPGPSNHANPPPANSWPSRTPIAENKKSEASSENTASAETEKKPNQSANNSGDNSPSSSGTSNLSGSTKVSNTSNDQINNPSTPPEINLSSYIEKLSDGRSRINYQRLKRDVEVQYKMPKNIILNFDLDQSYPRKIDLHYEDRDRTFGYNLNQNEDTRIKNIIQHLQWFKESKNP